MCRDVRYGVGVSVVCGSVVWFVFKRETAYEMRISDCSSDVCAADLSAKNIDGAVDILCGYAAGDRIGQAEMACPVARQQPCDRRSALRTRASRPPSGDVHGV